MKFSIDNFTGSVVGISVAIVIFAMVAVPIIGTTVAGLDAEKDANLIAIINILPIFMAIGILMACLYLFISKKA